MMEVLQFVFSSFWVWAGSVVLLTIAVSGLTGIFGALIAAVKR